MYIRPQWQRKLLPPLLNQHLLPFLFPFPLLLPRLPKPPSLLRLMHLLLLHLSLSPPPVPTGDAHTETPAIETSLSSLFSEFGSKLHTLSSGLSSLRSDFRTLERNVAREMRAAQKASKRKRKTGNRAPSGFVKPTLISKELAEFLGKPVGTELARTEVTREINAYIRANSLQDKENGRKINPDTKLKSLLQVKKGEELTYFNLQQYMSRHFAKASAAAPSVAAASS
jgi:hypothetical protein